MYGKDIEKVLITKEQIDGKIKEVAAQIVNDYKGESILFVCVLRGAFMFFADLVREVSEAGCKNAQVDFIAVSSYGAGTTSSGEVRMIKDCTSPVANKHVIIVEDIVDTGVTLAYLKKLFGTRGPKSVKICTMLDKPERRVNDLQVDYKLFKVPNEFVVGYGLDYNEDYRTIKDVCVLAPWVYAKNPDEEKY